MVSCLPSHPTPGQFTVPSPSRMWHVDTICTWSMKAVPASAPSTIGTSAGRNRWCCWACGSNRISRTALDPPRAHPIQPNRSNAMSYIDCFVIAVPTANRQKFIEHAKTGDSVLIDYGATRVLECWGDDVPVGKQTDFRKAVQAQDDEIGSAHV